MTLADVHSASTILAEGEILRLEIAEFQYAWTPGGPPASPQLLIDSLKPVIERMLAA